MRNGLVSRAKLEVKVFFATKISIFYGYVTSFDSHWLDVPHFH